MKHISTISAVKPALDEEDLAVAELLLELLTILLDFTLDLIDAMAGKPSR